MPTLKATCPLPTELEARVEAFERAFARRGAADLADFLPPADHPRYRDVLVELARVEIELLWGRRTPRPLASYLARFPLLQRDRALRGAVAYEDYRQRLRAGEPVRPQDYHHQYDLDAADWPDRDPGAPEAARTAAIDWHEPRRAFGPCARPVGIGGTQAEAARLPEVGDVVLGRFRIIERLGKGAFGSVYRAERLDLFNRPVALKFLPGPSVEPAMLAALIHENIVPIESADRHGPMLVICMPYRGRTTLQHVVDGLQRAGVGGLSTGRLFLSTQQERSASRDSDGDGGSGTHERADRVAAGEARPLSQLEKLAGMSHVEASLRITLGVANGLAHAHEHNIIHRDLKPANVLLADDGTPMLLDFNLAVQARRDRPLDSFRLGGTFPYMAPEQIQAARDRVDCRDSRGDLYSLGVVLFELLTGRHPFPRRKRFSDDFLDQMVRDRRTTRPDPCRLNPAVPRGVADIITKLLAFDPERRYQSARELQEDLERELSDRPLKHARESSPPARLAKFRRRHPRLTTALAALLLLFLPAGAATGLKYLTYVRVRQRERAEAVVKLDESLRGCYEAQTLAHSRAKDSRLLGLSLVKAGELARGYGIGRDAAWADKPEVSRLDEAQRRELLGGLGETFCVVSEALEQDGRDASDARLAEQARRWRQLAAECFEKTGRTPGPKGKGGAKAPDGFAELSEAELYDLAQDLIAESRFRQASLALQALTERKPKHFMAWFWRATCLDNLGSDAEAAHAWTVCTALQPDFAVCHYNLALARVRAGQYDLAERGFTEAYRLDGQLANALANRAICRLGRNNFDGADADLTEVLDRQPSNVWFRLLRARARDGIGRPWAAAIDRAIGLGREPGDEWGHSIRGHARLVLDRADDVARSEQVRAGLKLALADFDRALALNPRNRACLQNRAVALAQLNRLPEAVEACGAALKYYPDLLPMRASRGVLLARLGRTEEAIAEAKMCQRAAPPTPFMYYQLGSLYAALSKHDPKYRPEALRLLELSLARGLDRPELFRGDADLAALQGDERFKKLQSYADVMVSLRHQLARP